MPSPEQRADFTIASKSDVSGSVRALTGEPISNATVCAWPDSGAPQCTSSAPDGHYLLAGLSPVRVTVHAQAAEFLPAQWFAQHTTHREVKIQLIPNQVREHIDIVLRPGGVPVHGLVRDIGGGVIEGATVWSTSDLFGRSPRSIARSDEDGRFTLWTPPGLIDLVADASGYATATRPAVVPGPTAEVRMTPESVIQGQVVSAKSGEPIEGVTITASTRSNASESRSVRSGSGGRFDIDKLEPGVYEVGARGDELYGEAGELVHLGLAQIVDGLTIEVHPAFSVRGRVVVVGDHGHDEDRPCPRGVVRMTDRADDSKTLANRVGHDGEVQLRGVLPGNYEVTVHCDGMIGPAEVPDIVIADTSPTSLVWEVHTGLAIHGVVVDARRAPVAGLRVEANMRANANEPRAPQTNGTSDVTLEDGRFSITGLIPGVYEVQPDGSPQAPIDVVIEPGVDVHDVRVELPDDGTVAGTVRDPNGRPVVGVAVEVTAVTGPVTVLSDLAGRFVVEHVPAGPARILTGDDESLFGLDDVEPGVLAHVEAGSVVEVDLVVAPRDAVLRGRVVDANGAPVADAFVTHQLESSGSNEHSLRWGSDEGYVLTDLDGRFELHGVVEDVSYAIAAFRRGGGEALMDGVEPGQDVTLTLVETGAIAGRVMVPDGTAPERFTVTARDSQADDAMRDDVFRNGGRFRLRNLPPGRYTVIVESAAGVGRIEDIELDAGEAVDNLIVTLSPRVTVRGRIVDRDTHEPVPGMTVTIWPRGTLMRFSPEKPSDLVHTSDEHGKFELDHAPTGKVRISVEPRAAEDAPYEWQWLDFEVPAGDEVVDGVVDVGDLAID
jgi:protocatechuate 3,4-dioxygenase beta subunit